MASSLFNNGNRGGIGGNTYPQPTNSMLQNFQQFRQGMTPRQAEQQVKQLLQSGRMTQDQYNQLSQMAQGFMRFLK